MVAGAQASGGDTIAWDKAPNKTNDLGALQNGAKLFVNYCLNCHAAAFMRYNRLKDIGLTDEQIKQNLVFAGEKVGDLMTVSLSAKDASGNDISNEIQRVVLTGKPAHLEEIGNDGDLVISNADKIDYDADTSVAVLDGNVSVVRQGRSEFHGEHMVYNTETGEMESGNLSGTAPVHIVLQPKAKPAKPAADTQKKPDGGA